MGFEELVRRLAGICVGFKVIPFKTHANTSNSSKHILKPIQKATTYQLESHRVFQIQLKPTCIAATIEHQRPANTRAYFHLEAPARGNRPT